MDWRREEVLNLIEHYCQNTCLWDLEDPNYKNRKLKREALCNIANLLNRDVHDVEKKMHGLRTQFNREHKRYQKQVILNGRFREIPKPTWFAYEPLEFVAKCINPRLPKVRYDGYQDENLTRVFPKGEATWTGFEVEVENDNSTNLCTTEIEYATDSSECVVKDEPGIIVECLDDQCFREQETDTVTAVLQDNGNITTTTNPATATEIVVSQSPAMRKDNRTCQPSLKRQCFANEKSLEKISDFKFDERLNPFFRLKGTTPWVEVKDEYAAFALYVQQELKKISNPYGLQMAKLKINQVLFEGTTGSYDRPPVSVSPVKSATSRPQIIITSKIQPHELSQQQRNAVSAIKNDIL